MARKQPLAICELPGRRPWGQRRSLRVRELLLSRRHEVAAALVLTGLALSVASATPAATGSGATRHASGGAPSTSSTSGTAHSHARTLIATRALAAPTTAVLDDFDRLDENPLSGGGNWEKMDPASSYDLQLLSDGVETAPPDNGTARRYWTPGTFGPDAEVYVSTARLGGWHQDVRLELRVQNPGTSSWSGYELIGPYNNILGYEWFIRRIDGGSYAGLASADGPASPVGILFRAQGSTLEAWATGDGRTWSRVVSANDTKYAGPGYLGIGIGLGGDSGGPRIDNFGGGTLGSPPPASPPLAQSYGTCDGVGTHAISASECLSDPVNTLTGALTTSVEDLSLPGTGVSFAWSRSYTSADTTVGRLGPGWTDSYAVSLVVQPNGDVLLHGDEGQQVRYTLQEDGSYLGAPGSLSTLSSVAGGYELVRHDQVVYDFDSQGRLTSEQDRNGQGLAFAYDGQGRLATITDAAGRRATVSYNGFNLLSQVQTQDGRGVSYGYTSGRLTSVTDVRGKTWAYSYEAGGRLATIVDPLGHTQLQTAYGADGRVQSQTDALGKTTTFAWDPQTQIATVTDARGNAWKDTYSGNVLDKRIDPGNRVTQFGHDADLNTSAVTSPSSDKTQLSYDTKGNLLQATAPASLGSVQKTFVYNGRNDPIQVTDPRGKVTTYAYDASGNVQNVTQAGQQAASYTYDFAGRPLTFTDGNGKETTYSYDGNGNLASSTDPLGNKTTYDYYADGTLKTKVDPKGNCSGCTPANYTTTYTYTPAGQVLTETDPVGDVTTYTYDDSGNETSVTDANGHQATYTYDAANRLIKETGPDPDGGGPQQAPVTTYTYDDVGNKLTETDPNGHTTTYGYDTANRLTSVTDPLGNKTTSTYDENGNVASSVDPRGNVSGANPDDYRTTYVYDAAGRLLTTTDPLGDVTIDAYDPVGNLASVADANNHTTSYTYDAGGRILTLIAPDGGVTTYSYDGAGNLRTGRDDNGHTTTYAYDDASQLSSVTLPDPGSGAPVTRYTYDPNGNQLTKVDAKGETTTYGHDRANRLTSISYSDSTPAVSFTYDNVGNRLTMSDGSGQETRTYDALGRVLSVSRGQDTFSYLYDPAGNVIRRTYPDGTQVDYAYDADDRPATVSSGGETTSYAYDPASDLTRTTLPAGNGYLETRTYDRAGRLTDVRSAKAGQTLAEFASSLDPVGNPTQIVRTGSLSETQTYTYDAADRLTGVCFETGTCPGASDPFIRWTYDKVGNRLSEERPSGTTNYFYDALDELLSAGSTSYTYDGNGNELSAGSTTFSYDLANRLTAVTQGRTTTTYSYDGDGVRLQASSGHQANRTTNFLWDANQDLAQIALERDGNTGLLRRYVYGVRRISMTSGNSTSYYIYDTLGSVANLTSTSGAMQRTWSYEPFGASRTETNAKGKQPDNPMKFAGEYLDPTGFYHLRARQYNPGGGRFLSQDPLQLTTGQEALVSGYIYASDLPTALSDPSGMGAVSIGSPGLWAALDVVSGVDVDNPGFVCELRGCLPSRRGPWLVYPFPDSVQKRAVKRSSGMVDVHPTLGLPGYPAIDFVASAGTRVLAVQEGKIDGWSGHDPRLGPIQGIHGPFGWSIYLRAKSGSRYYYTHLAMRTRSPGDRVRTGQMVGTVGNYSRWGGLDHLHLGVNGGPVSIMMVFRAPQVTGTR